MAARKRLSAGPRPAAYRGIRISERAMQGVSMRLPEPVNPFQVDPSKLHPPGVRGVDEKGMALDNAYLSDFSNSAGWSYGALRGAIAEGQIFLGYPTLAALMQRVEYINAMMSIADDMTRKWIEFKAKAGLDKSERIEEAEGQVRGHHPTGFAQDPRCSGSRLWSVARLHRHWRHRQAGRA